MDDDLNVAAETISNIYYDIRASDKSMVSNDDYYWENWTKAGDMIGNYGSHSYDDIRIRDKAKI